MDASPWAKSPAFGNAFPILRRIATTSPKAYTPGKAVSRVFRSTDIQPLSDTNPADCATRGLSVRKTESIFDDIVKINDQITRRAYDIFLGSGGMLGKDLENWLSAERELIWKPAVELRQNGREFLLEIAVPGMEAKDLEIEITSGDLLVKGEVHHEHRAEEGAVHMCEFESGRLFRAIRFPRRIDPEKVKVEFKNGMLCIKAPIAVEQRAKKARSASK
jgi:HSP20 family molecular chaperone IbpA